MLVSREAEPRPGGLGFRVTLAPGESDACSVALSLGRDRRAARDRVRFGTERAHVRESLQAWHLHIPRLRASWAPLERSFAQSVADLAALRLRARGTSAGCPPRECPGS